MDKELRDEIQSVVDETVSRHIAAERLRTDKKIEDAIDPIKTMFEAMTTQNQMIAGEVKQMIGKFSNLDVGWRARDNQIEHMEDDIKKIEGDVSLLMSSAANNQTEVKQLNREIYGHPDARDGEYSIRADLRGMRADLQTNQAANVQRFSRMEMWQMRHDERLRQQMKQRRQLLKLVGWVTDKAGNRVLMGLFFAGAGALIGTGAIEFLISIFGG